MNKFKLIVLSIGAFLIFSQSVNAQAPVPTPQDSIQIKACEETADLAKRLTIENTSLKAQLDIEKEKTALEKDKTANAKEQAAFWKKASETGDKIDNTSGQTIFLLREQVASDRVRIAELEAENKSLRSSRNLRTVVGFGIGFGTGYWLKK